VWISIQRLKSNSTDDQNTINDAQKQMPWKKVKIKFTNNAESEKLVRQWNMNKMVILFQNNKKSYTKPLRRMERHPILITFQNTEDIGMTSFVIRHPKRVRLWMQ
jgi:hypothetical protein